MTMNKSGQQETASSGLIYDMRPELLAPTEHKINDKYGKMNTLFLLTVT